jgi:hypothetical protein
MERARGWSRSGGRWRDGHNIEIRARKGQRCRDRPAALSHPQNLFIFLSSRGRWAVGRGEFNGGLSVGHQHHVIGGSRFGKICPPSSAAKVPWTCSRPRDRTLEHNPLLRPHAERSLGCRNSTTVCESRFGRRSSPPALILPARVSSAHNRSPECLHKAKTSGFLQSRLRTLLPLRAKRCGGDVSAGSLRPSCQIQRREGNDIGIYYD